MERPKIALRHDERLLLNAILADEEVGKQIAGQLQESDAVAGFASRRVFQAASALVGAGGRLNFENLHARLEEADQNLLAEAVLEGEPEVTPGAVAAAMDSIRRSQARGLRDDIKARIREAERAGRWEEALRLAAELEKIDQAARSRA